MAEHLGWYSEGLSPSSCFCASWHALEHTQGGPFLVHLPVTQMVIARRLDLAGCAKAAVTVSCYEVSDLARAQCHHLDTFLNLFA